MIGKGTLVKFCITVIFVIGATSGALAGQADQNSVAGLSLIERALLEGYSELTSKAAPATDWLISESVSPSQFDQHNISTSIFPNGNRLVVWDDNRKGAIKIFGRRLDSAGAPISEDQLLVGSTVGSNYANPVVGIDSFGEVHLFYRNSTTGLVLGSGFDSSLMPTIPEFLLNDTTLQSFAGAFDAAIYPNGQAIVVWENYSGLSTTIEMSIVDSVGNVVLSPTTANSGGGSFSRFDPAVAVDPSGDFLIAWDDRRNGQADIFVRLFNGAGTAYGADESVLASALDQIEPDASFSPDGNFVIGWIDERGSGQVFAKRYNRSQGQVGSDILISDSVITSDNSGVAISGTGDSTYWAAWATSTPQAHIQLVRLDSTLTEIDAIQNADSLPTGQKFYPHLSTGTSEAAVLWEQVNSSNSDVAYRRFDSAAIPLMSSELILNSDSIGAPSTSPAIAAVQGAIGSRAYITFADERSGSSDIWLQSIREDGSLLGGNVMVSQDISGSHQDQPAIDLVGDKALIVWLDSRVVNLIPGLRIFGRYIDQTGAFMTSEFLIGDTVQATLFGEPKVTLNTSHRALTAWLDQRISTDSLRIYGRWLDGAGSPIGAEFELSAAGDSSCTNLSLDTDSSGNFYAIWLDQGKDTAAVKISWYDSSGFATGSFFWRPATDSISIEELSTAVNLRGEIALLWVGLSSERHLYLTVVDTTGAILLSDRRVDDSPSSIPTDPTFSLAPTGYSVAGWIDRRTGMRRMYYQAFDDLYNEVDFNTEVSVTPTESMRQPAVTTVGGRAWFSWVDPRANGQNIYASTFVYLPTSASDEGSQLRPNRIDLAQNYPNPFNPSTSIAFSLTEKAQVSLDVFNILGQQVKELVNREYSAGRYTVSWDGRNEKGAAVSSGVYLYRLTVGDQAIARKMLFLK